MKLPFPLELAAKEADNTVSPAPLSSLWATYDSTTRTPTSYSMNPFMKSLSAAVYGKWAADPAFLGQARAAKPYSNALTIRGSRNEG